jgi:hypothetical protein
MSFPAISSSQAQPEIRVKLVARGNRMRTDIWLRQLPGGNPVWGQCRFIFDTEARDYDWMVVYDDLPSCGGERFSNRVEKLACPRDHTLLVTSEPSSVKIYGSAFLKQFGHVLTGHERWIITHPGAIFSQPGLRWYYGITSDSVLTYDEMVRNPPVHKIHDLATVCSSKQQRHTLHYTRYQFVQKMKARLPDMDIFGQGVRFIKDKVEALDPYRYHLAIENHVSPHHWTEKLSDAFLGHTLPFYYGCPNAADYFPPESFIPIDINDVEGSAQTIRLAIQNNEYEKRLPYIREARRRVLEEYNLFAVVSRLVEKHRSAATATTASRPQVIMSRHRLLRTRPWLRIMLAIEKMRARRRSSGTAC